VVADDTAVTVALGVGVAQLFGWGIAVGRAAGRPPPLVALSAVMTTALGLGVVALEVIVHYPGLLGPVARRHRCPAGTERARPGARPRHWAWVACPQLAAGGPSRPRPAPSARRAAS
jgi:hypothetical protein